MNYHAPSGYAQDMNDMEAGYTDDEQVSITEVIENGRGLPSAASIGRSGPGVNRDYMQWAPPASPAQSALPSPSPLHGTISRGRPNPLLSPGKWGEQRGPGLHSSSSPRMMSTMSTDTPLSLDLPSPQQSIVSNPSGSIHTGGPGSATGSWPRSTQSSPSGRPNPLLGPGTPRLKPSTPSSQPMLPPTSPAAGSLQYHLPAFGSGRHPPGVHSPAGGGIPSFVPQHAAGEGHRQSPAPPSIPKYAPMPRTQTPSSGEGPADAVGPPNRKGRRRSSATRKAAGASRSQQQLEETLSAPAEQTDSAAFAPAAFLQSLVSMQPSQAAGPETTNVDKTPPLPSPPPPQRKPRRISRAKKRDSIVRQQQGVDRDVQQAAPAVQIVNASGQRSDSPAGESQEASHASARPTLESFMASPTSSAPSPGRDTQPRNLKAQTVGKPSTTRSAPVDPWGETDEEDSAKSKPVPVSAARPRPQVPPTKKKDEEEARNGSTSPSMVYQSQRSTSLTATRSISGGRLESVPEGRGESRKSFSSDEEEQHNEDVPRRQQDLALLQRGNTGGRKSRRPSRSGSEPPPAPSRHVTATIIASEPDSRMVKVYDAGPQLDTPSPDLMKPLEGPLKGLPSTKSMQASPMPPLAIRLPRVSDMALEQSATSQGGSRSPQHLPSGTSRGCVPQHFVPLRDALHAQRALGRGLRVDANALLLWYAGYVVLVVILLLAGLLPVATGAMEETLPVALAIMLIFPALHLVRLARCKRSLLLAVDHGSDAEVHLQLQGPCARIAVTGHGTSFLATLGSALKSLRRPPLLSLNLRALLIGPAARWCISCSLLWLLVQGIVRAMRGVFEDIWVELVVTVIGALFLVLVGCSPREASGREEEVDQRFAALEASFNAMLDTLRPLLGDLQEAELPPTSTSLRSQPSLASTHAGGLSLAALQQHHFAAPAPSGWRFQAGSHADEEGKIPSRPLSVRLVTADRLTLRAELLLAPAPVAWGRSFGRKGCQASLPALYIQSPLADMAIITDKVTSIQSRTLGRSAAGTAELPSSPAMSPAAAAGLPSFLTQFLDAGTASRYPPAPSRRQDDAVSTSIASVSTASTLRRNQPDEASLQLGMAMVTNLAAAQHSCPLELLKKKPSGQGSSWHLIPPKASIDELTLLVAVEQDVRHQSGDDGPPPWWSWKAWWPQPLKPPADVLGGDRDSYGVLHSAADVQRLCGVALREPSRSTPTLHGLDSDAWSVCSNDSEESDVAPGLTQIVGAPYLQQMGSRHPGGRENEQIVTKYVAILFDSAHDREICQKMLRQANLVTRDESGAPLHK